MLRLHIPLIKPEVRFSRIRHSDRISRFRRRELTRSHVEPSHHGWRLDWRSDLPLAHRGLHRRDGPAA